MWINLLLFNISWFGLILVGDNFIPITLCWLAFHFATVKHKTREILMVAIISIIGITLDSLLYYFQVFQFETGRFIPFWLMVLWLGFSATVAHSLLFLEKSKMLQFVVGGVFAPLSYIAGYNFGVVNFGHPVLITYFLLSMIWAPLMVLFYFIYSTLVSKENAYVN